MNIRLTRHARNRLRLWKLAEAQVVAVLTEPDRVTPSHHGRQNAWKYAGERWLRVSFIEEKQIIVVITVTVRRRGPQED